MSGEQWFVLRIFERHRFQIVDKTLARSLDIEKLKSYAQSLYSRPLEWTERNRAKLTDWSEYYIAPERESEVVVL